LRAAAVLVLLAGCATQQPLPEHTLVRDPAQSAASAARRYVVHLAAGEIDAAAAMSNAPEARRKVLNEYRARVGDAEFRRVFAEYLAQPVLTEVARGERRLVIRRVDGELAGQYFVRAGGDFAVDDELSEERAELQQVLRAYRSGRLRLSAGTD
jgi:hypothetical protein